MKRITLLILVILLTGCFGSIQTKNVHIQGIIYHDNTDICIYNAKVEVKIGSKNYSVMSDINGQFELFFHTTKRYCVISIDHPDYQLLEDTITVSEKTSDSLEYNLIPKDNEKTLVTGRVDYALPEVEIYSAKMVKWPTFTAADLVYDDEITEIMIQPFTYSEAIASRLAADLCADYYRLYPNIGTIVLGKPVGTQIDVFLSKVRAHPLVYQAEINYPVIPLATPLAPIQPNDEYYDLQWSLETLYLPWAWQVEKGSKSVRIAVLDTGVDTNHEDLRQILNLEDAYNVFSNDSSVQDPGNTNPTIKPVSHGTHVIGIIGAETNNGVGIAGVTWQAEIIPILALKETGGTIADVAAGINKAVELGVDIINLSLGVEGELSDLSDSLLHTAVQSASDQGIILVAAAGNRGQLIYPAKYPEVIAVGATTREHTVASYSASDGVRLFAPGGHGDNEIISTDLNSYSQGKGTSMAAPHVTGLIALIKAKYPYISGDSVEELLWNTGIIIEPDYPEHRLVNAYAALTQSLMEDVILKFTNRVNFEEQYLVSISDYDRCFYQMLTPGDYLITAHIDTNHNETIDAGEWYYERDISVEKDSVISGLDIRLQINN